MQGGDQRARARFREARRPRYAALEVDEAPTLIVGARHHLRRADGQQADDQVRRPRRQQRRDACSSPCAATFSEAKSSAHSTTTCRAAHAGAARAGPGRRFAHRPSSRATARCRAHRAVIRSMARGAPRRSAGSQYGESSRNGGTMDTFARQQAAHQRGSATRWSSPAAAGRS